MRFFLLMILFLLPMEAMANPVGVTNCVISAQYGAPHILSPDRNFTICRDGYEVVWSPRTRNPIYVQEIITREMANGKAPRSDFREDPYLPAGLRTSLSDYRGAKTRDGEVLARGHMAPADDFSGNARLKDETL